MDGATKSWLIKKFGPSEDEVFARLVTVQNLFNFSNEDIYIQWEAFVVTHENGDADLSLVNIEKFQQYLQDLLANNHQKRTPAVKKVRDLSNKRPIDFSSSPGVALPSTPSLKRKKPILTSEPDSSPSKKDVASSPIKAQSSNTVLETLNPDVEVDNIADNVQLTANFDPEKFKFRTMAMKLLESADVLDDQIDMFSQQLLTEYKDKDIQLGNPCMSSQFDIVCCGRIVPDSPFYDSMIVQNLNDKSLFLETSRLGGIGQRIPLDLSNLEEYSFFPGQVVGLRGRNPTGRAFVAHDVIALPQLGTPVSSGSELSEFSKEGSKILIAAGPFTNQHTLDYSRLEKLVDHVNTEVKPQAVLLFGPFLDITNKAVESGNVELPHTAANQQPKNLDELFRAVVTPVLKIVLLPSLKDSASKHASYPQSSLDRKRLGLPKNFKCFPNPSNFSINEIMVGASNADVFKDLKDIYKSGVSPDKSKLFSNRFERIANHVFEQRRFYPVFPGSVKRVVLPKEEGEKVTNLLDGMMGEELAETEVGGSSLEVPYIGVTELNHSLPDVLIVPSELKYFAKVIKGVVVINPGQFIRPNKDPLREDGSYVVMTTRGPDANDESNIEPVEGSDLFYHNVFKRSRIDIMKT
ncbi:CIC11C00000003361 [Sungouiella intermedia]|uniref:DNA polymerase alpha subunit B n=1 Tax=Sungouiella intermedia TaxID=45354 RepID=A0A1L0BCQ0_9ASCO|nr:CIC11C00000003361 [[Candida] intermedia]